MRWQWMTSAAMATAILAGCGDKKPDMAQGPPPPPDEPGPMTFENAPSESGAATGQSPGPSGEAGPVQTSEGSTASAPERVDIPPDDSAKRTHTVKKGDTLYSLAKRYLNNGQRWQEILDANPKLDEPTQLRVGDEIVIPPK